MVPGTDKRRQPPRGTSDVVGPGKTRCVRLTGREGLTREDRRKTPDGGIIGQRGVRGLYNDLVSIIERVGGPTGGSLTAEDVRHPSIRCH